jgi:hypothetical protein
MLEPLILAFDDITIYHNLKILFYNLLYRCLNRKIRYKPATVTVEKRSSTYQSKGTDTHTTEERVKCLKFFKDNIH